MTMARPSQIAHQSSFRHSSCQPECSGRVRSPTDSTSILLIPAPVDHPRDCSTAASPVADTPCRVDILSLALASCPAVGEVSFLRRVGRELLFRIVREGDVLLENFAGRHGSAWGMVGARSVLDAQTCRYSGDQRMRRIALSGPSRLARKPAGAGVKPPFGEAGGPYLSAA